MDKYVYEKPADERLYEEMRRKSLQGEPVKRQKKRVKIDKKKFIRSMAVLVTVTVGVTLASNQVYNNMSQAIQENALYGTLLDQYMEDVFYPATHHVDGTTNEIYLDYEALGDYIDSEADKKLAVSLTNSAIEAQNFTDDEDQMDRVLQETELGYDSYDQFLQNQKEKYSGYEDHSKFLKNTKTRLMNSANSNELDDMHEELSEENVLEDGGKNL